jgi:hypothetical protein
MILMRPPPVLRIVAGLTAALALTTAGCDQPSILDVPPPQPLADASSQFDPATTGTISGRVFWEGELPIVEPFRAPLSPLSEHPGGHARLWPNPHAPAIDQRSGGVGGAVVFLRGIDPRRARPWHHPPVIVELRDYAIHVLHDKADRTTGIVRRGDMVELRSTEEVLDTLQARGAAFFSLPFPLHGGACHRPLGQAGIVELMSGAGHFWMRGHLFVDDHPYYTWTDSTGHFTLEKVPSGDYDLVCWHPNWHEASHERDADTGLYCRLTFQPPAEVVHRVTVRTGGAIEATFALSEALFRR